MLTVLKMHMTRLNSRFGENGSPVERLYNKSTLVLFCLSVLLIAVLPLPICFDVISRNWFGIAVDGIMEFETLSLVAIAFLGFAYVTATSGHIKIDLIIDRLKPDAKIKSMIFADLICMAVSAAMFYSSFRLALEDTTLTHSLHLPEAWFIMLTSVAMALSSLGFAFLARYKIAQLWRSGKRNGVLAVIVLALLVISLPFLYKLSGIYLSRLVIGGLGFLLLFALLFNGVPIGLTMIIVSLLGLLTIMKSPGAVWGMVAHVPFRETSNFILVSIPMFMLMGELTAVSGISRELFDCANKWLGHSLPGGLACATVTGCAGFGAICGESVATVITMSKVALPAMREYNYSASIATGSLAAGGTIAILIPPSMGFIFYSIMTEESVGKLFIAGIIPGLLLTLTFIAVIVIQAKLNPEVAPRSEAFPLREKLASLLGLVPMALIFLLVIGGIMGGYFTPGEGGAVGAMGTFLYSLARRRISFSGLVDSMISTAYMSGKILIILVGVYVLGSFLTTSRVPQLLAAWIISMNTSKFIFLAVVVALYLVLGCVMNLLPMMMLTMPAIYPSVLAMGFDGIWFGVITVMLMECGMITPPVGMNVFTMSSLAPDIPMATIFRGVMPFFIGMLVCIFLIIAFPQLALWLPQKFF